jgi:hypothetical protein
MATTTNYGWTTPDDTALVKDGAAAIRTLGSSVDTTTKALNPSTTLGDIEYRSSTANTNTRLGIGSTGNILTVSGGVPTWAAPASAGGMTLISTTTLTGSSVSLTSIPSTYVHLQLIIKNYLPTDNDRTMNMQYNSDTNTRYRWANSGAASQGSFNTSGIQVNADTSNSVGSGISTVNIYDYTNTTTWKVADIYSVAVWPSVTTELYIKTLTGVYNQTSAISSIQLAPNAGTFASGTVLLYGVK